MQTIATIIYKLIWKILIYIKNIFHSIITYLVMYCNNVKFQKINSRGIPFVRIARTGVCKIGNNFKMNNNITANPIGRIQRCSIVVNHGASLTIGNNVGMSSTAIVVHLNIQIGNYVKIGGGVCIYDTDFHSLNSEFRKNLKKDRESENCQPVIIEDNVFIGAHTTLLKGITIGKNSIIGACSVVTKSVPPYEIWAGNPAKYIKRID